MQERFGKKPEWRFVDFGNGHKVQVKELDPEIVAKMPVSGRTFLSVGPAESFVRDLMRSLKGEANDLFP